VKGRGGRKEDIVSRRGWGNEMREAEGRTDLGDPDLLHRPLCLNEIDLMCGREDEEPGALELGSGLGDVREDSA
jgi:hypothetical protein